MAHRGRVVPAPERTASFCVKLEQKWKEHNGIQGKSECKASKRGAPDKGWPPQLRPSQPQIPGICHGWRAALTLPTWATQNLPHRSHKLELVGPCLPGNKAPSTTSSINRRCSHEASTVAEKKQTVLTPGILPLQRRDSFFAWINKLAKNAKQECTASPARTCDHDIVLVDGHGVHNGALWDQRIVQELSTRQGKLLDVVRAGAAKGVLKGVQRHSAHTAQPNSTCTCLLLGVFCAGAAEGMLKGVQHHSAHPAQPGNTIVF
eukprot:1133528-Pelagomonas_calceolata.AAC.1